MARRGENIYKRKDGRWEGRYKSGYKEDGSAKYSSIYGKTYSEVKAALLERYSKSVCESVPANLTVRKLFELWFNSIKMKVKESTYMNYHMKAEKHILPALGGIIYEKLTVNILNDFVSGKVSEGLALKYVADIAGVIKSVFRFARKQYGYSDKSEFMVIPKGKSKEKTMLEKPGQNTLNKFLIDNPTSSNIGILLACATGMRIGELCALKWGDIDLEKRIITVRHTVQRIKNTSCGSSTKIIVTSPKTSSSMREIPIPEFMISILAKLKATENCFLLSGTLKIIEPRTMQYRLKSILKKLKLKDVSFHSLRHAFATNCITLGFDVKTLSEILGHSSVEITLNLYVHSSLQRKAECMERLSRCFSTA